MLRPIIDAVHGLRFVEDELETTVITRRVPLRGDDGVLDWWESDISGGFHVYSDDEVAQELAIKANQCYPEIDVAAMFPAKEEV